MLRDRPSAVRAVTTAVPTGSPAVPGAEEALWFNLLDPFLQEAETITGRGTGVASERLYKKWKQCVVYDNFPPAKGTGSQDTLTEYARTYKMNTHLRSQYMDGGVRRTTTLKVTQIKRNGEVVLFGDGISLDLTGDVPSCEESGTFSMQVGDDSNTDAVGIVGLRHNKGANILFVDGHASNFVLPRHNIALTGSHSTGLRADTWPSEFVDSGGNPVPPLTDSKKKFLTEDQLGLRRNPDMPLIWSWPGIWHR